MFERTSLMLCELHSREAGQAATEYAVVIGFLVVALALGIGAFGVAINNFLGLIAAAVDTLF